MLKQRPYSRYAQEATLLLGKQIELGRKQQKWTQQNLAERAGICKATLQKIEKGKKGCAIGLVFELAALVGVELFVQEAHPTLSSHIDRTRDKITLLPQRIRTRTTTVHDAF